MVGAAGLLSRGQANERGALTERFESRASTGASFVGAYVDYMFETERRLVPRLTSDLDRPEEFTRTTALIGSSAAVLLDHRGRVVAVAPAAPELRGHQLAAGYPHLSSALAGKRTVSDVVPSAVEGTPIVAFALPLSGGRFGVFSAGFTLPDSPLKAFLARQPLRDTRGYILDSTGATIVSAGRVRPPPRTISTCPRYWTVQGFCTVGCSWRQEFRVPLDLCARCAGRGRGRLRVVAERDNQITEPRMLGANALLTSGATPLELAAGRPSGDAGIDVDLGGVDVCTGGSRRRLSARECTPRSAPS